jgi:phosphoglycolate phosphatase-like HAD superfamily hydrolase
LAIDFDGVVHKYSKGFQGLANAYDPPTDGTRVALEELIGRGYRLIIISSRPAHVIEEWLIRYDMIHFFDEVTNIKQPAKYYIDDHAIHFDNRIKNPWKRILEEVE